MHVVAIHTISNPDKFFEVIQAEEIPSSLKLHSMLPSRDRSKAVCVWEAESAQPVKELVEGTVGDLSTNEFFEVEPQGAMGLP